MKIVFSYRQHLVMRCSLVVIFFLVTTAQLSWAQSGGPSLDRKVVLTPEAQAEKRNAQQTRASRIIQDARVLYRNGAYEVAIKRFEEAFKLTEDDKLLYNIALSYQQLRDWTRCIGYLDRYLETAPNSPRRDRALNAKRSCQARQEKAQTLHIETRPPGAAVYLANRNTPIQGYTPFKARLPAGVQRVWLELNGYEPEIRDIEIRAEEPFRLSVQLRKRNEPGWLFVDSTIRDAQVYVDGRAVQLTPFPKPISITAGRHQLQVKRDGFGPLNREILIESFQLTRIDAPLERTSMVTTWRSTTGWVSLTFGLLSVIGGGVATYLANQKYNDTQAYSDLVNYETLGYGIGSGLLSIGAGLIVWDYLRDDLLETDRNPDYGRPVDTPDPLTGAAGGVR
ncbi:MAG: PEGA domain-containing protein [Myxococcota bacterium]|nr:PEGA domain-containing protein [Myxococcota bacterium]